MSEEAVLVLDGKEFRFPVVKGTENEKAIDLTTLRKTTGYITMDPGYGNTGSCESAITFIDGEKGILRYRGIPIEELAEKSTFIETAYLLIWGKLPSKQQLVHFSDLLTENALLHENFRYHFDGFPAKSHPMAILSAMINTLSCYHKELTEPDDQEAIELAAGKLISKVRTIAAFSYKMSQGQPYRYPDPSLNYVPNLLHMMFSFPYKRYEASPAIVRALDQILILHADHEQNCSTSTVRMVASSKANLYSSISAGVCSLWGPLHGGANMAVIDMLERIHQGGLKVSQCVEMAKKKDSGFRLFGFGHRVYRNYDPRAKILKKACDEVFKEINRDDPLLDIARELEEAALHDDYFVERKLYPNVDFYSGIILKAIGFPPNMFTVLFAIGRLPGWISQWRELAMDSSTRISRPRQIYTGETETSYTPIDTRK